MSDNKVYITELNPPSAYNFELREGDGDDIIIRISRGKTHCTSGAAFLRGETEADLLQAISYATRSAFVNYVRSRGIDLKTVALNVGRGKKDE